MNVREFRGYGRAAEFPVDGIELSTPAITVSTVARLARR
jgi:hypothetical protein